MSKIYIGDIGTVFTVDCGTDITGASVKKLKIRKPDATLVEWSASVVNTNYLRYTLVSGDLDQAGIYYLQAYVEDGGGKWHGERTEFFVHALNT